jgi:acetyl-CoA carboxylase carboxyl transferase subunit beta
LLEDLFNVVKTRFNVPDGSESAEKTEDKDEKSVEIPKGLVFKCPRCLNVVMTDELVKNLKVCPNCGYHSRISAAERLSITADKDSFIEFDKDMTSKNPIDFPGYEQKQEELRTKTGLKDAVITGECTIRGIRCVIGVMDSRYMMASMGSVVGEKITRAFEYATENKLPVIMFTASGGARMQEGIVSLMQMAKTCGAAARHSEAGLLYISVMTDPTTGGVTASFASVGDIIIAEPKVLIGFAGRRVIEGTIKQRLPDDFQTAEFMLEHGFVDMIVERKSMRRTLAHILKLHTNKSEPELVSASEQEGNN